MTESPFLVWLENSEKENQELKYLQYLITKNNVSTDDSYRNILAWTEVIRTSTQVLHFFSFFF